jgi:hypothetical protein
MDRIRRLKIVKAFTTKPTPLLPLKGHWLAQAGFPIGMQVDVIVREQCLVILPSRPADAAPPITPGPVPGQGSKP